MTNFFKAAIIGLGFLVWATVSACAASGTIYVDCDGTTCTGANGALATNSGTTNTSTPTLTGTAAAWTTATTSVTLDVNTNISSVAGCSAGTCDGSQAIYLVNSTNSQRHIFWLLSYTGCTGTGACVVVVDTAPTCTTCAANAWTIGGRYLYPSGSTGDVIEGALRPGDTVQFNTSPASKTTAFINTNSSAGSAAGGRISVIGKAGVSGITLTMTATGSNGIFSGSAGQYYIANLTLSATAASTQSILGMGGSSMLIQNVKISGAGGNAGQHCVNANSNITLMDSELTGCGGSGVNASSNQLSIVNCYIHGNGVDGITSSSTTNVGTIRGNVIAANGGRGIYFTNSTATNLASLIDGNTIYGNTNSGLEVTIAGQPIMLRNNIIQSTSTGVQTVKWDAGTAEFVGVHDHNIFWNSADSASDVTGLTLNSTEAASNPAMTAPGSGNFAISNSSPAANAGTFGSLPIAGLSTGYRDIGAIQRQAGASGGSPNPIIGGG